MLDPSPRTNAKKTGAPGRPGGLAVFAALFGVSLIAVGWLFLRGPVPPLDPARPSLACTPGGSWTPCGTVACQCIGSPCGYCPP
ncbi:MAG: hypothetical protein NTW86_30210, partial [Candidatus Sumerlaeota bacterium]|nr:hypothetical protein [Candidatus Sumerlaeota bacterium]